MFQASLETQEARRPAGWQQLFATVSFSSLGEWAVLELEYFSERGFEISGIGEHENDKLSCGNCSVRMADFLDTDINWRES